MAKKSYKPQDNELPQVNEPVAAYHELLLMQIFMFLQNMKRKL